MGNNLIDGNTHVNGEFSAKTMSLSAGSVGNAEVKASAAIDATKLIHQIPLDYQQAPGSNIAAATLDRHIALAAGNIVAIRAAITGVAAGGDREAIVDLQKSTGGGAFATVLTAPITLDDTAVLRTAIAGVISSANYVAGDILRFVITVAGASGTQPQGLVVTVWLREQPQ